MPQELTEQVVIEEFTGTDTVDLTKYTLYLLGLVDGLNVDRATVRSIVEKHNE